MKLPRAVVYMLASAFAFSVMSMLVKVASARLPTGEIVLARGVVTLVVSYLMVVHAGLPLWGTNRRGLAFRGVLGFGGLSFYYLSIAYLPLADATTIQNLPAHARKYGRATPWFVHRFGMAKRGRGGWPDCLAATTPPTTGPCRAATPSRSQR